MLSEHDRITIVKSVHEPRLFVMWLLGNTCPYKCSYCEPVFNDGRFQFHAYDAVLDGLAKLEQAHVMFSGGEPSYHPEIERLLDNKPSTIAVSLISNAARPLSFWERVLPKLQSVIFTYHVEFANFERFASTARLAYNLKKLQRINLTMLPERWDECRYAYSDLKARGFPVSAKPLVENFGFQSSKLIDRYTQDQLDWISQANQEAAPLTMELLDSQGNQLMKTNPSELLAAKATNFKGWLCYTPTQFLMVDFDGSVYDTSCAQRRKVGQLGEYLEVPKTPVVCEQSFCWCHSDILPKKEKLAV